MRLTSKLNKKFYRLTELKKNRKYLEQIPRLKSLREFVCLRQGSLNNGPRAKSGPRRHFVNNEKRINLQKLIDLAICNISRNKDIA